MSDEFRLFRTLYYDMLAAADSSLDRIKGLNDMIRLLGTKVQDMVLFIEDQLHTRTYFIELYRDGSPAIAPGPQGVYAYVRKDMMQGEEGIEFRVHERYRNSDGPQVLEFVARDWKKFTDLQEEYKAKGYLIITDRLPPGKKELEDMIVRAPLEMVA